MFVSKAKYEELEDELKVCKENKNKAIMLGAEAMSKKAGLAKEVEALKVALAEAEGKNTKLQEELTAVKEKYTAAVKEKCKCVNSTNCEYVYYVSYWYKTFNNGSGFGSSICHSRKEIKNEEGNSMLHNSLKENANVKEAVILNFQLLDVKEV